MSNADILAATTKFCKTKPFVVGAGGTSIVFTVIIMGFVNPMILANADDIDSNGEDIKDMIASVSTNTEALSNIDKTLQKLDHTIGMFDEKIHTLTIVICDMSLGEHCD